MNEDLIRFNKRLEAFCVNNIEKTLGFVKWNSETRIEAFLLINKERDRQDIKWGEQNHSPERWGGILEEEYGEYCQVVKEIAFDNSPNVRQKVSIGNMIMELTHIAAVAVCAIECIMRSEDRKENRYEKTDK